MMIPPRLILAKKAAHVIGAYLKAPFERNRFRPPEVPALSIETTNICNAKCVFCANPSMKRLKEPLTMDLFKKAVEEFVAMGGTSIDFNVTIGDPLLDKTLLERARFVKQFPQLKSNGFVTTLQWLHLHDIDEFFNAGFMWISISTILSGRQAYHDFFRVDLYDQMLKNLVLLLKENQKRKVLAIIIDIKPSPEPAEDILNHPDYCMIKELSGQDLDRSVKNRTFYVDDWIGAVQLPPYLKKRPLYPRRYRPCRLLYKGLMVYSNGNVGACSCRDFEADSDLILGNLKSDRLPHLWHGERLEQIRSQWLHENKVPNICQSCRHYLY
jgi:radical SAM protein with 4Fe4S-binding SPASM domain